MQNTSVNKLYPVFLKLHQLNVLIVGGGNVGYEKLHFMLKSSPNANVTLVAKSILPQLRQLAKAYENVRLIEKAFEITDLNEVNVLIAATESRETNAEIRRLAKGRNVLVNVADTPDLCDFYLGGIVTKGDLKIAISTNGKSPSFAKRFRQMLEAELPENLNEVLAQLHIIRGRLKNDFAHKVKRLGEITSVLAKASDEAFERA